MTKEKALLLARLLMQECCIEGIRNKGGRFQRLAPQIIEARLEKLILETVNSESGRD